MRVRRDKRSEPGSVLQLAGMRDGAPAWDAPGMTLRLLIVDDSPRFLDAARGLRERQGMTVAGVASDSAAALRQAEALQPDVVLVDVDLGGESGFELARRLHRDASLAHARTILISTHHPDDFAELTAASPALGFLPKADLSASAILDLLGRGDGQAAGR
jgi:DNA-binding NarL/FixJ family response regulator